MTGRTVTGQEFFTPIAFDFLWEAMRLGELPYPLKVRSHGATEDERVALRNRVHTELRARGIRDQQGRLEPYVDEWLTLLARPTVSVDALHIPEFQAPPVGVLAASDGRKAVVAIQDADGIWLRPIYPEAVASTVVDLLPSGPRGTEASATLPLEEALRVPPARATVGAGQPDEEERGKAGLGRRQPRPRTGLADRPSDPRQAYAQLAGQPRLRGGQLAANSRSSLGARRRSPVLAWFDTATGRYLSLTRPGPDGREWVTVSPADAKTLRTRLGELVASVTDWR
ncbi:EspG family protein [Amycolatopsis arida]|uniref:EspG family protein n=1 Tax=Amycolatopsis arida TaxID=587909 RepID=A0A1I5R6L8_9PSEU|nr:ESX secretion-associated protein EspG [Amycolatopsis arida]TDX99100.1 ESAT-6 protein secretion system EspG family protein [Amycolatopsis arida]SFP54159.1 EspG family protein [Amycolatopsis arida]